MKNFSAKNAEFETLTINNEAAISSADLGTAPNQIPLNKDLGSLAYQDAVNLDDVSADMLELRAIAAEISDSAVDVFVYDTSRDSDGGAWRKRTQHTSWYNETLNTATRGGRREFPAVAVIVAEAGKVTIYDGDDPDLGMWMVFNANPGWSMLYYGNQLNVSGLAMLNGKLCVVSNNNTGSFGAGVTDIDFLKDRGAIWYKTSSGGGYGYFAESISGRNIPALGFIETSINTIVNHNANDVAMTILPNAPIDSETGLPIPTIAVACGNSGAGGFSIINHDGTVANKEYSESAINQSVSFASDNRLVVSQKRNSNGDVWVAIYDDLTTSTSITGTIVNDSNISIKYNDVNYYNRPNILSGTTDTVSNKYIMSNSGLSLLDPDEPYIGSYIDGNPVNIYGMAAYVTSKYNTGWMPGDIKLATLSDTTVETIGESSDELVTNGDFSTDVTGWSFTSGASISHDTTEYTGGALQINQNSSSGQGAYQSINTIIGQSYVLNVIGKGDSIGNLSNLVVEIGTSIMGSELGGSIVGSGAVEGNVSITFVASSTITYISLGPTGSDTRVAYVNNISVRATTELITNGDFSNGITGWVGVGATISIDTQRLKVEVPANTWGAGSQTITGLIVGKTYVLTATITNGTGQGKIDNSGQGVASSYFTGTQAFTFTCTNSSMTIRLYAENKSTSNYAYFDNISVRPAEEDRSVNGNGLQIFGEIQKTPVAPGADLVAYSGFSANNYLVQPYNEDLNFGAGDFCFLFWVKAPTSSEHETIFEGGYDYSLSAYSDNCFHFFITDSGPIAFSISNTGFQSLDQFICLRNIRNNTWSQVAVRRVGDIFEYYINGQFDSSHTFINSDGIIDFQNSKLTVGCRANNLLPMDNSSLSSLRISATAPTAEQIAKIYRDEKVLFTDGAQATLYGTSDAVTALAYDEKTELLHVGTSSGRSDFSGLRRINNTTTAITTSISAHNNLIAEQ